MRNLVFVAPFAFETTLHFLAGAAGHPETRLALVSQDPLTSFPGEIRRRLAGHWLDTLDAAGLSAAVSSAAEAMGPIHASSAPSSSSRCPWRGCARSSGSRAWGSKLRRTSATRGG